MWDTVEIPETPLSSGLRDGKDRGMSLLCVGHSGNPVDSSVLGWDKVMGGFYCCAWDTVGILETLLRNRKDRGTSVHVCGDSQGQGRVRDSVREMLAVLDMSAEGR